MGINYSSRTYKEGKKIGWKDGVRALWGLVKYSVRESSVPRKLSSAESPDSRLKLVLRPQLLTSRPMV